MKETEDSNENSDRGDGNSPDAFAWTELDDPEAPARIRRILESRATDPTQPLRSVARSG